MYKIKNPNMKPMTDEEDAEATRHAIEDGTVFTDEELSKFRRVGRPFTLNPKKPVTIRLDAEVLNYFRNTGKGWQTRVNAILRDYVAEH